MLNLSLQPEELACQSCGFYSTSTWAYANESQMLIYPLDFKKEMLILPYIYTNIKNGSIAIICDIL